MSSSSIRHSRSSLSPSPTPVTSRQRRPPQPPSNVRDEDVTSVGLITRPLAHPTPILHLILKAQIAAFARSITDRIYSVQFPPSWAVILELNAEFSRLDSMLPQCVAYEWVNGSVKPFEDETRPMDGAKILVHLLLRQQCIRLHRPLCVAVPSEFLHK